MLIEIQNFRCFKSLVKFSFQRNKLTLLKGHSGAGKSTILEAIRWCLFGSLRNIYPSGFIPSSNNKTFVNLEIGNLKVNRSQSPELLCVSIENYNLTQEVAQRYIDSVFGNKNIWSASSFIKQNEKCMLMTANNSERLGLLNEILFGSDLENTPYENPDYYLDKIDEELEKTSKDITGQTAIFNLSYTRYTAAASGFQNIYNWENMTLEQVEDYSKAVEITNQNITDKSSEFLEITKLENTIRFLEEKLSSLGEVREIRDEDIKSLNLELNDIQNKINKLINDKAKYDSLQKELNFQNSLMKPEHISLIKISPSELQSNISNLKNDITSLERDAITVKNTDMKIQSLELQIKTTTDELKNNEQKLNSYSITDIELLKRILSNTQVYQKLQELKNKKNIIQTQFIGDYTHSEDVDEREKLLQMEIINLQYATSVCQKYGINLKEIDEKIVLYQQVLDFDKVQKQHLQSYKLSCDKKQEIEKLQQSLITNFSSYELYTQEIKDNITENGIKELIALTTSRLGSPLKCPHCSCVVEYNNGVLSIPQSEIIDANIGKIKIEKLKELLNIVNRNNIIELSLNRLQTELQSLPVYDDTVISAKQYSDAEIAGIQSLINECSRISVKDKSVSIENLNNELHNIKTYKDFTVVEKEIKNLEIQYNPEISIRENTTELQNEILTLPMLQLTIQRLNDTLSKINDEYNQLKLNRGVLSYEDINSKVLVQKEQLTKLERDYNDVIQSNKIQNTIDDLYKQMIDIDILSLSPENLEGLEKSKKKLQSDINESNHQLIVYKEHLKIKQELSGIILITSSQIIQSQIDTLKDNLSSYIDLYNKAYQMYHLLQERTELEKIRNSIIDYTNKQANLNTMKSLIIDTVNGTLENLVISINNSVNSILEDLFDTNIIVELKLYKELKTGKNKIKPSVNMSIYYNGNTFDNVNMLSGGEQARISLAFTLALASIHHSPVVFLDEVMGALNADLREQCVEVIKKFLIETSNKTVVSIEHNFIEGLFDDIIELKP
jgi:DNA repair exonuclease SbcCD ATPase subunit